MPKPPANKDTRQSGMPSLHGNIRVGRTVPSARQSKTSGIALPSHPANGSTACRCGFHMLGVIAHQVGKNDLASDYIQQALRVHQAFPDAYMNLGTVLSAQKKWAAAVASYRQAVHLKPNHFEAHNSLGNALKHQGQLEEAIASYRQAVQLNPQYALAYLNLGRCLEGSWEPRGSHRQLSTSAASQTRSPRGFQQPRNCLEGPGQIGGSHRQLSASVTASEARSRRVAQQSGQCFDGSRLGRGSRGQFPGRRCVSSPTMPGPGII